MSSKCNIKILLDRVKTKDILVTIGDNYTTLVYHYLLLKQIKDFSKNLRKKSEWLAKKHFFKKCSRFQLPDNVSIFQTECGCVCVCVQKKNRTNMEVGWCSKFPKWTNKRAPKALTLPSNNYRAVSRALQAQTESVPKPAAPASTTLS